MLSKKESSPLERHIGIALDTHWCTLRRMYRVYTTLLETLIEIRTCSLYLDLFFVCAVTLNNENKGFGVELANSKKLCDGWKVFLVVVARFGYIGCPRLQVRRFLDRSAYFWLFSSYLRSKN